MAATPTIKALLKLSAKERLKILGALWDSLAAEDADLPLDSDVLEEMKRRSDWARANPDKLISHEEMAARLRSLM